MSPHSKKAKNVGGYPEEKPASEPTPESKPAKVTKAAKPNTAASKKK